MSGDNPAVPAVADAGAAAPPLQTQVVSAGGYTGIPAGYYSTGISSAVPAVGFSGGDAGVATAATGADSGALAAAATDAKAEMPVASMVKADSAADANLVISKDADGNVVHTWNKPLDSSNNYQCKVFVDDAAKADPSQITQQLQLAKSELENGSAKTESGAAVSDKKLTFSVPNTLPEYMTKTSGGSSSGDAEDSANEEADKNAGDPEDQAPSGGGSCNGGGSNEQPADDKEDGTEGDDPADSTDGENTSGESSETSTPQTRNIMDESLSQLDSQKDFNARNAVTNNYARSLWNSSLMSSYISSHMGAFDKNGDGKIDEDEMKDAMEKLKDDPEFKAAQKDLQDKIGNDPALADFKNKIGTAEGLSQLSQMQKADTGTQTAYVNNLFNAGAQEAITKQALSQELKTAGIKGSDNLPSDEAEQNALLNNKIQPILDRLVNVGYKFAFK